MQTLKSVNRDKSRRQAAVSRQTPNVENLEKRELLTGGMLQGYAVVSNSGSFSMSDTPSTGVQIDLLNSSGTKVVAQTTTNSDGYYQFTNITPGNYILEEVQGFGVNTTGVQANSLFDNGTAIHNNTAIAVTVVNPSQLSPVTVSRNVTNPAAPETVAYTLANGPFNSVTVTGDDVHQYQLTLSGSDLTASTTIYSFCTDLFHADPGLNGNTYQLNPSLTPSAPALSANAGQIGYLYNHFGTAALSSTQGGLGLQVAIWALLYNQTASLTSGNFQVVAPGANSPTDAATFAAAQNFLKISAGKSEGAFFLNNSLPADTLSNISYTQGMIATENFDFTNASSCHPCPPCPPVCSPCPPICPPTPVCPPTPICPPSPPICPPSPPICQPTPCQPSQPVCGNNNYGGNNCQSIENLICEVFSFLESFC